MCENEYRDSETFFLLHACMVILSVYVVNTLVYETPFVSIQNAQLYLFASYCAPCNVYFNNRDVLIDNATQFSALSFLFYLFHLFVFNQKL